MSAAAENATTKKLPTKSQLKVLGYVRAGKPYEGCGEGSGGGRGARTTLLEGMRLDGFLEEHPTGTGRGWCWVVTDAGQAALEAGEFR